MRKKGTLKDYKSPYITKRYLEEIGVKDLTPESINESLVEHLEP
jgi:hypothetical protein